MTVEMYRRQIQEADLEKLAALIRICGFLLQSKVYLSSDGKEVCRVSPSHFNAHATKSSLNDISLIHV